MSDAGDSVGDRGDQPESHSDGERIEESKPEADRDKSEVQAKKNKNFLC